MARTFLQSQTGPEGTLYRNVPLGPEQAGFAQRPGPCKAIITSLVNPPSEIQSGTRDIDARSSWSVTRPPTASRAAGS